MGMVLSTDCDASKGGCGVREVNTKSYVGNVWYCYAPSI